MARPGGKDRGLFQRKGSDAWWVRWRCPLGHDHQEKGGTKKQAQDLYNKRQVQKVRYGFCLRDKNEEELADQETIPEEILYGKLKFPLRSKVILREKPKKYPFFINKKNTKPIDNPLFEKIMPFLTKIEIPPNFKRACVYFLCYEDRIVYVGKSDRGIARLYQHIADGEKKFDSIFIWWMPIDKIDSVESACIHYLKPIYNLGNRRDFTLVDKIIISNAIEASQASMPEIDEQSLPEEEEESA